MCSYHDNTTFNSTDDQNGSLGIDLKLGLDIILDCDRKTLKFEYQGITFDASKCYTLYGKEYAPFIVFKGKALAPIKLEYVSGPEGKAFLISNIPHQLYLLLEGH